MKIAPFEVEENKALRDKIILRARQFLGRPRSGIHVSDLLFPRRAYFTKKHPEVKLTEREVGYFIAGRAHHEVIEALAVSPEYHEQSVEWNGIRGCIDVYNDMPVEIKTTRAMKIRGGRELVDEYPHYFEQIGMYCAMARCNRGWLLIFYLNARENNSNTPKLVAHEVRFEDLGAIRREMAERKRVLEEALIKNDPGILPQCPGWMCRDCKYQEFCLRKTEGGEEK